MNLYFKIMLTHSSEVMDFPGSYWKKQMALKIGSTSWARLGLFTNIAPPTNSALLPRNMISVPLNRLNYRIEI